MTPIQALAVVGVMALGLAAGFVLGCFFRGARREELTAEDEAVILEALQSMPEGKILRFVPLAHAPIRQDVQWACEARIGADGEEIRQ